MRHTKRWAVLAGGLFVLGAACDSSKGGGGSLLGETVEPKDPGQTVIGTPTVVATPGGSPAGTGGTTGNQGVDPNLSLNPNINARKINYGEALRTATLKLVGALPTLADIKDLQSAIAMASDGGKAKYESKIDALLADPRFAVRQIQWWRDTLKTGASGEPTGMGEPDFDAAATFAAEVVVNDMPYTDLFTATSGTCPTFANGTFTPKNCPGSQPTAGILTDPGLMAQYYADMAFRRVRFVQETFVCSPMPAELSGSPQPMGAGLYTSPWPFTSISGGANANINFQDTSAVICANCHTTLNHIAPLFAYFDQNGSYNAMQYQVSTPIVGEPTSVLTDWLPNGQQSFAWRYQTPITDLPSLGAAIAADPDVAQCAVNRVWNYAMSRGDIVNDLATVPPVVTATLLSNFTSGGMKLKGTLRDAFTSDDFVEF